VQVFHDLLGFNDEFLPKHARRYASAADLIRTATRSYADDVRARAFPTADESFGMQAMKPATAASAGHPADTSALVEA
jgi:3-methyl-2-oxobutanoate hydroxymethyltransferase